MVLYLGIFGLLAILSYKELFNKFSSQWKKSVLIVISCLYILLSTIYRGPMGDFFEYQKEFINTNTSHLVNISSNRFEYLYEVLSVFVRFFTPSYAVFRMVTAIIVIALWYKVYTYEGNNCFNKYPITILLVVWALTFGNIFIVRSTIAVALCMYSLKYIHTKKIFAFLLCTIIAFGFHRMAIVWIPAYLIYNFKNANKFLIVFIILAMCLTQYMPDIVLAVSKIFGQSIYNRIAAYINRGLDNTYGMSGSKIFSTIKAMANMVFLIALFVFTYYTSYSTNILKKDYEKNIKILQSHFFVGEFNLYLMGALLYVIALSTSMALTRAALPYTALQYILLPHVFESKTIQTKLDKFIVFVVFIVYLLLRLILTVLGSGYLPFLAI